MIISFSNAFAGRSTLMSEITDNPAYKVGLPDYNEVLRLPFYDKNNPSSNEFTLRKLKELTEKHVNNICAFTFEPMQGEGGYNAAPREFFLPLLEFCRSQKIPVWLDEVQTFSRTGEFFAFETLDIGEYVDLCSIAKTAQVGCTLYTEEFNPKPGLISGTFSGSSVALNAGLEIIKMIEEGNYLGPKGRIQEIHHLFVEGLNRLNRTSCQDLLKDAGGLGLMVAVTPLDGSKEKVDQLSKKLFEKGLMTFTCGKNPTRIRFLIPAVIENKDIDVALTILEESILSSL